MQPVNSHICGPTRSRGGGHWERAHLTTQGQSSQGTEDRNYFGNRLARVPIPLLPCSHLTNLGKSLHLSEPLFSPASMGMVKPTVRYLGGLNEIWQVLGTGASSFPSSKGFRLLPLPLCGLRWPWSSLMNLEEIWAYCGQISHLLFLHSVHSWGPEA